MTLTLNKILSAAIIIVVLAIIIVLYISILQSKRVSDTEKLVSQTELIIRSNQNLKLSVLDNETGSRGYVITGTDSFLEPLRRSEKVINTELALLKTLVSNTAELESLTDSISFYAIKRIAFSHQLIALRREKGFEPASMLVKTNLGKYYTDKVRQIGDLIQEKQNALLKIKKSNNQRNIAQLNTIFYTVLMAGFILSALVIQKIRLNVRKLTMAELKFSALLDAAPDATVIVNEKGIIQMANLQMEKLFGYTKGEITGQPVETLLPQALRTQHVYNRTVFVKEARARSMGVGLELKAIKNDGTSFPVEISLSPIKTSEGLLVSASIRDISLRKTVEEKLKKSQKDFQLLVSSVKDYAILLLDKEGKVASWNSGAEHIKGYTAEEIIGKPLDVFYTEEEIEKGEPKKNLQMAMQCGHFETEGWRLRKDGSSFYANIVFTSLLDENGNFYGFAKVTKDITEKRKAETALSKLNAELEAFTYSVSHDLRAPLRGIIGFTAILEEDYASKLDDEARRIAKVIRDNTLKMGHLIDDLLAFSHMGRQEIIKTTIDTSAMVHEIVREQMSLHKGLNKIRWDIRDLTSMNADVNTIRQVWINLISNAMKYSGLQPTAHIEIGSYANNGQNVFYVQDDGVGFEEQYADKLFKVFQRLHGAEEFEGTGVGLALVERIISKHGGNVWAKGKENAGARFSFSLPI
ncbi:MAG TPA: PAS domain S-box protein [Puia sp.]|nr:PAS domain S-box protein [Puia sp.]